MYRWLTALCVTVPLAADAATAISVHVGRIQWDGGEARDVTLSLEPDGALRAGAGRVDTEAGALRAGPLRLTCAQMQFLDGLHCASGSLALRLAGADELAGPLQWRLRHAQDAALEWQPLLGAARVMLSLRVDAAAMTGQVRGARVELGRALSLAAAAGWDAPADLEVSGSADADVSASLTADGSGTAAADWRLHDAGAAEPSGRFAAEGLQGSGSVTLEWQGGRTEAGAQVSLLAGEAYVEPVYWNFEAMPLHVQAQAGHASGQPWQLTSAVAEHPGVMHAAVHGRLSADTQDADLQLEVHDLAPLLVTYAHPWLAGTPLDGIAGEGRLQASVQIADGAAQHLHADLRAVGLTAPGLGAALEQLSGTVHWAATGPVSDSRLDWTGGSAQRVSLGASTLRFQAVNRDLRLLQAWRQPLLDGALIVRHLSLRNIGAAGFTAQLDAELEPLDLAELCRALDWPVFSGRLSGRLPGMHVEDDVWWLDGGLEANVFDGTVRVENLRAIDPLGVVPRLAADLHLRRLDLEQLTGTFEFGRITGRLDGDISGLRLLNWSPVAMDAHLYSTPGDRARKRISQRAIDNITAIGGGPSGLLSRGALRFFQEFAYARIGWRCRLHDNVCQMDGLGPAPDGGYYLVRGRLLPRIDVVGHNHRVSWSALLSQVEAVLAAEGATIE